MWAGFVPRNWTPEAILSVGMAYYPQRIVPFDFNCLHLSPQLHYKHLYVWRSHRRPWLCAHCPPTQGNNRPWMTLLISPLTVLSCWVIIFQIQSNFTFTFKVYSDSAEVRHFFSLPTKVLCAPTQLRCQPRKVRSSWCPHGGSIPLCPSSRTDFWCPRILATTWQPLAMPQLHNAPKSTFQIPVSEDFINETVACGRQFQANCPAAGPFEQYLKETPKILH